MKEFNRVAVMSEQEPVSRGFMFEYVMEQLPYKAWAVAGESLMDAFEKTFSGMEAPAGTVRDNREKFIAAVQEELKAHVGERLAGHEAFTDLTNKIREVLQPLTSTSTKKKVAAPAPGQP